MDVWTYFAQRERDVREFSLIPSTDFWEGCFEEEGSDGNRGRILNTFQLTDNAYLAIHELVEVRGNHMHREEYGYFLIIDGEEIWGEERDLSHAPAVHRHSGAGHDREDSRGISFKDAVELAWEEISRRGFD